jgi:ribosomal protein S18 acetylase RimI-like enzyme
VIPVSTKSKIRPATPTDALQLTAVKIAAWRSAYADVFDPGFLDGLDYSQQYWDRHLDGLLVSAVEERVVGYCSFGASDVTGWGEIRAIYVHPAFQGRGHGSRLLAAGVGGLVGRGFEKALLWVIDRNRDARSFYEALGWVRGAPIRLEEIGGASVTLLRYEMSSLTTSVS